MRAKVIVNAAGPWVNDFIGRVAGSNSSRNVRLVKGSHIIVPKFWEGRQAYLVQNHDKRVIFINPYEGDLALIGTTDIAYEGRPEDVTPDETEIDYLIAAVNRYFKEKLRREDVRHELLRRAAAVRRRQGQSLGGDARLCLRPRRDRRRAAAQRLRRQDHHLPRAGRARHAAAGEVLPEDGRRLDRHGASCPAARSRMPTSCSFAEGLRTSYPWMPRDAALPLRPHLRRPHRPGRRRRDLGRGPRPPLRRPALRGRGALPGRERMGADAGGRAAPPHQAGAAHDAPTERAAFAAWFDAELRPQAA